MKIILGHKGDKNGSIAGICSYFILRCGYGGV